MKPILFVFCLLFAVCCRTQTENPESMEKLKLEKVLIVYLTRTNNTKVVAEIIQDKVGGKLIALEKENPYPENYQEIVAQVDRENNEGYLPPLKTKIENLEDYDTVFIGFPTWDMQLPPPMKTFLKENDLSGKTLVPFNTNAGYGLGSSLRQIKGLCPDSRVLKEFSVEGGYEKRGVFLAIKDDREEKVEEQVEEWLREIGEL